MPNSNHYDPMGQRRTMRRRRRHTEPLSEFRDYVSAHDRDVLEALNIDSYEIVADSVGIEIELDYSRTIVTETARHIALAPATTSNDESLADRYGSDFLARHFRSQGVSSTFVAAQNTLTKHGVNALAKWDGTVGNGFEYATAPMPFADVEKVATAYADLLALGARATCRCGLHVHVNRLAFGTNKALAAWVWLWSAPYESVLVISGRARARFDRWSHPYSTYHLFSNHDVMHNPDGPPTRYNPSEHYSSVCLRKRSTAELRVFAAPTTALIARGRIQLTIASVVYVRTIADISNVSWQNFMCWLAENHATYPAARAYIMRRSTRLIGTVDFGEQFGAVWHPCKATDPCNVPRPPRERSTFFDRNTIVSVPRIHGGEPYLVNSSELLDSYATLDGNLYEVRADYTTHRDDLSPRGSSVVAWCRASGRVVDDTPDHRRIIPPEAFVDTFEAIDEDDALIDFSPERADPVPNALHPHDPGCGCVLCDQYRDEHDPLS